MDIRISEELRAKIPQLGEVAQQSDPMVWLKLTCEKAGWTWYVIEMQELVANAIFFVYTVGWDEELHYLIRSDLERKSTEWGFSIVQDETFVPCPLSQVQAQERGARKFPLGQLVATPGAAEALMQNNQEATAFVRRHWRGDWGELDAEDIQENEFSLVNNLRLLSRYSLADGTAIYIITEADRSVTTILLPSEY